MLIFIASLSLGSRSFSASSAKRGVHNFIFYPNSGKRGIFSFYFLSVEKIIQQVKLERSVGWGMGLLTPLLLSATSPPRP